MSSAASRKRQRQRRRAQERLWAAQRILADRQSDLISYERVIADMKLRKLSPIAATAIPIVVMCRNAMQSECDKLADQIVDLEAACKKLQPAEVRTP